MPVRRIYINLKPEESIALEKSAQLAYRSPRDHAKFILLTALGLLPEDSTICNQDMKDE